jgi:hypothetical protein
MAAAGIVAAAAVAVPSASGQSTDGAGDLPFKPEWVANTLTRGAAVGQVKNNTIEGAIQRRDQAKAEWADANARYRTLLTRARAAKGAKRARAIKAAKAAYPNPLAKPEYSVVWSAKQNGADVNADVISKFIQNATINPQGLADLAGPQFAPGLDGFQVIDVRKFDVSGKDNPDYGKVVNFVQLPLPWGVETEAHHMQYQWQDGEPIVAGGLYNGANFVLDPKDIPNLRLQNVISQAETPLGSIVDAFDAVGDGRFIGTHMGGPVANFGGSPGSVYTLKPDAQKGLVLESETPAGAVGGISAKNAGGVPEPCSVREARPLGTCANPHGIEIRKDIDTMVTSDYAEPREIVLDPVKTIDKYAFRPTTRTWDVSNPGKPVLKSVAHMPKGWRQPAQRAHENYGIMENAKTWGQKDAPAGTLKSNGFFSGSMCGGGVFFNPDPSNDRGDSSRNWVQVWDDGLSQLLTKGGNPDEFLDEPGGCAGGAWHQVSRNNKWFFRSVQGRNPGSDNYFDSGSTKLVYNLSIEPLIRSAQDGKVDCDLTNGIDTDGNGSRDLSAIKAVHKLAEGQRVADCPYFLDGLPVKDPTTGGPHWAALDNHSITPDGYPTRLNFSNYFVSRTGVDGDHRYYSVDIDPSGKLAYDKAFRDEKTGAIGVNFNRRDWPGSPDAGFYKPHSMLFVCPPGVCPKDGTNAPLPPELRTRLTLSAAKGWVTRLRRTGSARLVVRKSGGDARKVRVVVKDAKGRVVARSATLKALSKSSARLVVKRSRALRKGARYRVTVVGYDAAGKRVAGQARTVRA